MQRDASLVGYWVAQLAASMGDLKVASSGYERAVSKASLTDDSKAVRMVATRAASKVELLEN